MQRKWLVFLKLLYFCAIKNGFNKELYLMTTRFFFVIFGLFCFEIGTFKAQDLNLDSLENLLRKHKKEDVKKVDLLCQMAEALAYNDLEKTREYAQDALNLSLKLNYTKGKAMSNRLIGISYERGDRMIPFEYFQKALAYAQASKDAVEIGKCYNRLGINYRKRGEKEKAEEYLTKALKLSQQTNDNKAYANYLSDLAGFYFVQGFRQKALEGFKKSVEVAYKTKDKRIMAKCQNNLSIFYAETGNYIMAYEHLLKSIRIKEQINDKVGVLNGYNNIGFMLIGQEKWDELLKNSEKTLLLAQELKDERGVSTSYERMGYVYLNKKSPKALEYFQKSLKIGQKLDDKYVIMNQHEGIALYYLSSKDFDKALEFYQKALQTAQEVNRRRSVSEYLQRIGQVYVEKKDFDNAKIFTQKSLKIADELNLIDVKKRLYLQFSQIDSAFNDFRQAYLHYKLFKNYNDSIFNEKNVQKMTELEVGFQFEKEKQVIKSELQKQQAIQKAQNKNQKNLILLLGVIVLLFFSLALFFYTSFKFKNKTNQTLLAQKKEIEQTNQEYEALNEEYQTLNEELLLSNEQLWAANEIIKESKEKLRLLIKNSNDIIVLVNEKGEQFFVSNAAKALTGYEIEELLGPVKDVIYHEDIEIVQEHWKRVIANKNATDSIQYRHKHKEKGYVWFEVVAQNYLEHNAIKAVVANVRDITERKKVEQALKEAETAKAALMQKEIERINCELENNQKTMTSATLRLIQNSERDTQTIERLIEIEKNTNPEGKQKILALISEYKRKSYEINWSEFEILFQKVHRTFYEKLNQQYPTLTSNERKICAFLKLNMSSKDMAQITFQSEDALKKARLRLRQKLELNREINLSVFIQNI